MQYIVIARDYADAFERRMAVREGHLALFNKMRSEGKALYGVALLDDNQKMIGSMLVVDFSSRDEIDEWLVNEPYMIGKVWEKI